MPTTSWNGNGQNISQVDTLQITAVAIGGVLTATINGKNIFYTCVTGDTTTTAATAWAALLDASTVPPEFTEMTWANPSDGIITATANTPGTPFTLTKSQSGGATCTLTHTIVNSSQSDVNNAANWIRNGVASLPQNGDDVVLANTSIPLLWNLDLLSGVLLNSWTRYQSFTGTVGLPENNPINYVEYRPTYLLLGSNVNPAIGGLPIILGHGQGSGPTRERYNAQSYRATVTVTNAGSPQDAYAIRFLGLHGQNSISVIGTSVAICMLPTEISPNGSALNLASVDGGGQLDCGVGCAFSGTAGGGTITVTGGSATLFCTPNVVARNNATINLSAQNGVYSSVSAINGVQVALTCAMTITSLTVQKSSNVDASNSLGAITVTTSTIDGDTCQILDPNNTMTFTNATQVAGQVTSGVITFTGPRSVKVT